jgi:hypothetical protein
MKQFIRMDSITAESSSVNNGVNNRVLTTVKPLREELENHFPLLVL